MRNVSALAPQLDPANLDRRLFLLFTLSAVFCRCCLYDKVRSKVTPRYTGKKSCLSGCPSIKTANWREAKALCRPRWKTLVTVFVMLGLNASNDSIQTCELGLLRVHSISAKVLSWTAQQMSSAIRIDELAAGSGWQVVYVQIEQRWCQN